MKHICYAIAFKTKYTERIFLMRFIIIIGNNRGGSMGKFKEYAHAMLQNALYDIIKTVLLAVITAGIFFPTLFSFISKLKLPLWCVILLCIGIVAIIFFIVLSVYQRISYKYISPVKIDCDYTVLNKEVKFNYNGDVSYFESYIKIEFIRKSQCYYGKYYWSGSGSADIKVTNQNYNLVILKRRTRYIEYMVRFDKAYKKGKKLTFKLQGELHDPQHTFSPYISTSVDVPTKTLRMTLNIDQGLYPITNLEKEEIIPYKYDHENCEFVSLEGNEYEWQIEKPQLGNKYCLTWIFK